MGVAVRAHRSGIC